MLLRSGKTFDYVSISVLETTGKNRAVKKQQGQRGRARAMKRRTTEQKGKRGEKTGGERLREPNTALPHSVSVCRKWAYPPGISGSSIRLKGTGDSKEGDKGEGSQEGCIVAVDHWGCHSR